jgi:hypothetical protein
MAGHPKSPRARPTPWPRSSSPAPRRSSRSSLIETLGRQHGAPSCPSRSCGRRIRPWSGPRRSSPPRPAESPGRRRSSRGSGRWRDPGRRGRADSGPMSADRADATPPASPTTGSKPAEVDTRGSHGAEIRLEPLTRLALRVVIRATANAVPFERPRHFRNRSGPGWTTELPSPLSTT